MNINLLIDDIEQNKSGFIINKNNNIYICDYKIAIRTRSDKIYYNEYKDDRKDNCDKIVEQADKKIDEYQNENGIEMILFPEIKWEKCNCKREQNEKDCPDCYGTGIAKSTSFKGIEYENDCKYCGTKGNIKVPCCNCYEGCGYLYHSELNYLLLMKNRFVPLFYIHILQGFYYGYKEGSKMKQDVIYFVSKEHECEGIVSAREWK